MIGGVRESPGGRGADGAEGFAGMSGLQHAVVALLIDGIFVRGKKGGGEGVRRGGRGGVEGVWKSVRGWVRLRCW